MKKVSKKANLKIVEEDYRDFDQINGKHPYRDKVPNGFIEYPARKREGGKVVYFNFSLARQMGLISDSHPDKLNKALEQKILDTFSIVIINEYDIQNQIQFDDESVLPNKYMATRYLQLQHESKKGETSGDGRSIWNGKYRGKNSKTWDITSCGTGATCLSPATSKFGRFFQTGDPTISYGCGYAETVDGLAGAIMSEIFFRNGIPTERCLGIIEFEKGISINIRAGINLLRPSHLFIHLKQNNYTDLKGAVDYYIDRQTKNKNWDINDFGKNKYKYFLNKICDDFARAVARFESDYIFCWLDWDGDNILMDGGIIDYGSIRQFGLYHYEYRYDDVERWSTNLSEQKGKAKYIVQTFAQLVDFLITKKKGNVRDYSNHSILTTFDDLYLNYRYEFLLERIGFKDKELKFLLDKEIKLVQSFFKVFSYFEKQTSPRGLRKVSDGITKDAVFCMRDILRELPGIYLQKASPINEDQFINIIKSSYAKKENLIVTKYVKKQIAQFQALYIELIKKASYHSSKGEKGVLKEVFKRSQIINKYEKITGDGILHVCNTIFKKMNQLSSKEIYDSIENLIIEQSLIFEDEKVEKKKLGKEAKKLEKSLLKLVHDYSEGL